MNEKRNDPIVKKTRHDGTPNLIPASMRTPEERKALGRLGGLKSAEVHKQRKDMREVMRALLSCEIDITQAKAQLGEPYAKLLGDNPTIADLMSLAQIRESLQGNSKAFEVCRDTAGYMPKTQVELETNVMSDADRALLAKVAKRMQADNES